MVRLSIRKALLPLSGATSLVLLSGLFLLLGKIPAAFARPSAATFIVSNTADSGLGSLRSAIQDANRRPGADLISVTAAGTLNLLTPLPVITDTVSIVGSGAGVFYIDSQDQFGIIDILGVDVSMIGLAVQRGLVTGPSANGAGIRSTGDLVLEAIQVLSNTAQGGGGGMYVTGDLVMANGLFRNNRSINGYGGALRSCCLAVIIATQFLSNTDGGDGGGAYILGDVTIMNGLFQANQCQQTSCDGGGLYSFSQTTLANTHFISSLTQPGATGR